MIAYTALLIIAISCHNIFAFQTTLPNQSKVFRTVEIPFAEKGNTKKTFPSAIFSPLFSSANDDGSSKSRKPFNRIRKTVSKITANISRRASKFSALSRRAKTIICVQLLIIFAIFGGIARSARSRNVVSPIEVPYSQFMDIAEKSPLNSNGDDLQLLDVKIGSDRIGFQLARGSTSEQRKALQNLRQGKEIDAGISIPLRAAYTRKVAASPELISYLRQNKVKQIA